MGQTFDEQFIIKYGIRSKKIIEMLKEVIHTEEDYNLVIEVMNIKGRNKLRFLLIDLLEERNKNTMYKDAS